MNTNIIPLSLYVHIPWCVRKCPYCDFNSHQVRDELPEEAYIDRLIEDLKIERVRAGDRSIHSIFIGGGTPSLFKPESYQRLLNAIRSVFRLEEGAEVTLEANPGTFEQARFSGYRSAGINRVSIGVQTFNNAALQRLGRIHNADEAIAAIKSARAIFERINIDLMHGLPEQTPEQAIRDLNQAIELSPDQISWYQLTIEPNTEFAAKPPQLPIEESLWAIQEEGQALLESAGFKQYEISAFAREGGASKHNINYWQFGDYIGIGAGAHGKLTYMNGDELVIERTHKHRQPKGYLGNISMIAGQETIDVEDRPFEFMLNALRLTDGVPSHLFSERTGIPLAQITPELAKAYERGLLQEYVERLAPTNEGRLFLNDLLTQFID